MTEADDPRKAAQEAAEWLARLNSRSISTEELNAFYEWRRIPQNAEAYGRGEQLWHESRSLGDDRDVAQAVRDALQRPRLERNQSPVRLGRRAVLTGGAIAAAAGAGWIVLGGNSSYRTAVGEQLAIRLEDGSLMRLDTDSEASVNFSSGARRVQINKGQGFFEVQHDPMRSFTVRFGVYEAVALGTRFDVAHLHGSAPKVVLVDGRVQVASIADDWTETLSVPGDAVYMTASGRPTIGRVDPEAAVSWTLGRLTFRRTPLAAAIAEVNRYSRKQIELRAPELSSVEVDGVFETGDPKAFIAAVTAIFPLRARAASDERIVLVRA